jgi:hypothetical protein
MHLPPGKKPLRLVEQQSRAEDRVVDLVVLLDYALAALEGGAETAGQGGRKLASPSERVKRHAERFQSLPDVLFAIGVRNDLVHPTSRGERVPTAAETKRAAKALRRALVDLLPALPPDLREAIAAGSHVDRGGEARTASGGDARKPQRARRGAPPPDEPKRAIWPYLFAALLLVVGAPPLIRYALYGAESDALPLRRDVHPRFDRLASTPHRAAIERWLAIAEQARRDADSAFARREYRAAASSYVEASNALAAAEVRLAARTAAERARSLVLAMRDEALRARAPRAGPDPSVTDGDERTPTLWRRAESALAAAETELEAGSPDFGLAAFAAAKDAFEAARDEARAAWEAWAESALAAAAAAESSGALDVALAELLPLVLAADERAARRFDSLAPSTPEFLAELALAEVEGDAIGDRLERIRFLLALAARGTAGPTEPRADSSPPPLRAAALLDRALEDALAIEDARVASEMLLAVADALARFVPDRDLRPVLDAADDGLAVLSPDPETALRFARLAALAARHEDDATRQASFRSAHAAASRADPFARFSAAVFLADAGQLAEAFDAAYSLIGDPLRELAGLALAWVAWRAAEHDDTAIQRKAALAAEATMLDGSTPRGATALLQLMRADLLRDRVDTADERRLRISFAALRVAADCAFAEHLAAHDDESRASAILAAVDLAATTFGAGAVAEIAAARAADAPPSHLVRSALDLPRRDLRAAALGALSQTYAAR